MSYKCIVNADKMLTYCCWVNQLVITCGQHISINVFPLILTSYGNMKRLCNCRGNIAVMSDWGLFYVDEYFMSILCHNYVEFMSSMLDLRWVYVNFMSRWLTSLEIVSIWNLSLFMSQFWGLALCRWLSGHSAADYVNPSCRIMSTPYVAPVNSCQHFMSSLNSTRPSWCIIL